MSAIKRAMELSIYQGIGQATGMPFIGKPGFTEPEFTEEEMEMGRYDHARSDERDSLEDEE